MMPPCLLSTCILRKTSSGMRGMQMWWVGMSATDLSLISQTSTIWTNKGRNTQGANLEETVCRSAIVGAIFDCCLLCQVISVFYRRCHSGYCEKGSEVSCVWRYKYKSKEPPDSSYYPSRAGLRCQLASWKYKSDSINCLKSTPTKLYHTLVFGFVRQTRLKLGF